MRLTEKPIKINQQCFKGTNYGWFNDLIGKWRSWDTWEKNSTSLKIRLCIWPLKILPFPLLVYIYCWIIIVKDINTSVLCAKIEMRANKDVFHDAFTNKPHHVSTMCPLHVQGCELLEGAFETVGSKICWTYTLVKLNI